MNAKKKMPKLSVAAEPAPLKRVAFDYGLHALGGLAMVRFFCGLSAAREPVTRTETGGEAQASEAGAC